jgi:membrane-associated phospholipid phosphatase
MTAQQYEAWTRPLRKRPFLTKILLYINKALTALVYVAYPLLLLVLLLQNDARFLSVLLTPAISFVLVSVFRSHVNAPRPYEQLDIQPLIHKDTHGHSFPSRHVFSSAVISCAFLYTFSRIGMILLLVTALLAVIRVLGGVHFPRDVIAGFCIGLFAGWIGFVLL